MAKNASRSSRKGAVENSRNGAHLDGSGHKGHPLNVPMKKSEMSHADKLTLRASKLAYKNRENRMD